MTLIFRFTANEVSNKFYFCLREFQRFIISSVFQITVQINVVFTLIFTDIHSNPGHQIKQAEKLKSREVKDEGGWGFCRQTDRQIDIALVIAI